MTPDLRYNYEGAGELSKIINGMKSTHRDGEIQHARAAQTISKGRFVFRTIEQDDAADHFCT